MTAALIGLAVWVGLSFVLAAGKFVAHVMCCTRRPDALDTCVTAPLPRIEEGL